MRTTRLMGTAGAIVGGLLLSSLILGPPASAAPEAASASSAAAVSVSAAAAKPKPKPIVTDDPIAHDPTMIKQGKWYYVAITGDAGAANTYLPMKRSKNLKDWEELGPVFTSAPKWIVDTLGVTPADFWAPELSYANGRYRLYYSASQFGTNNSLIALATNATLDPSSPDYKWVDEGLVLRSTTTDNYNAIDPDVTVDSSGRSWFAYGSFWSGISIRELDSATGKLLPGAPATQLVDRFWAPNAVEAPAITQHGGFYYLFTSFDYCCRGADSEYRTMVGRSTSITGPYVDRDGQPLVGGGGTELLRGYNEFAGPGGGDIVVDGKVTRYVHHYYDLDDNERPKLSLREVVWGADGWPSFTEPLVPSASIGHGPAYFAFVEKTSGAVVGTVPGGPAAPRCGYEGADIRLLADAADPCAAWRLDAGDDGYVALRNLQTNKVAEAAACGIADGTNVAQWGWLHNDCQQFRLAAAADGWLTVESKVAPAKFLDGGLACSAGADVAIWSASATRCQQFRLQPTGPVLLASASGEAVASCSQRQPDCTGWRFAHTSDGYYRISNGKGAALPVSGCKPTGHRNAQACDEWRLVPVGDGAFQLAERTTGKVLTQTRGNRLELQPATDAAAQRFLVLKP